MAKPKQDILTIAEVSEYLKIAERTLYRLANAKKIPAFKVGGTWRFSQSDIGIWIKQQTAGTTTATKPTTDGGKL